MEKELFINVLKNFSKSSENEALNIISLKQSFPYSQVLQALAARLSKDHDLKGKEEALQTAAIYASDRAVLKSVMTLEVLPGVPANVINGQASTETAAFPATDRKQIAADTTGVTAGEQVARDGHSPQPATVADEQITDVDVDQSVFEVTPSVNGIQNAGSLPGITPGGPKASIVQSVADEVMDDLEKLHRLKHDFEVSFEANQAHQANAALLDAKTGIALPDKAGVPKSNRVRITESAKSSLAREVKEDVPADQQPKVVSSMKRHVETLINEIVNGKQKIEPDSPKQMEQIQMIDKFIKTQPTISSKDKFIQAPEGDLATTKTGEFTDNIVSETLVEILLKQGKHDKAIEVLKKLIWKFPQKKAYFAAQIEDLKK